MLRDTSLKAYQEMLPYIPTQKEYVLNHLKEFQDYDFSRQELAEELDCFTNAITARVKELLDDGLIEEGPKRTCCITGRTINPVRFKKN